MIILVFFSFLFFFFSPLPPLYSHYCLWTFHSVDRGCVFTYHLFSSSLYGKLTRVFSLILYYWEQCMWLFFLSFFSICFLFLNKRELQCQSPGHRLRMQKKKPQRKTTSNETISISTTDTSPPSYPTHPPTSFQATSHSFIFQRCFSFPAVCPGVKLQRLTWLSPWHSSLIAIVVGGDMLFCQEKNRKGFQSVITATCGHFLPIPPDHLSIFPSLQHSTPTLQKRKKNNGKKN